MKGNAGDIVAMMLLWYDRKKDKWRGDDVQVLGFMKKKSNEEIVEEVILEQYKQYYRLAYSYVHNAINHEAFPNAIELYNKEQMTGRGRGKYAYKTELKEEAKKYLLDLMKKYFPNSEIKYIV